MNLHTLNHVMIIYIILSRSACLLHWSLIVFEGLKLKASGFEDENTSLKLKGHKYFLFKVEDSKSVNQALERSHCRLHNDFENQ